MRVLIDRLSGRRFDGPLDDRQLAEVYAVPRTPWLRVNMVSTVDGAATGANGKTGSINNPADKRGFDTLRALADAVVVGAGTARAEGYREEAVPLVLVSRRGEVPERLRNAAPGKVLLATCATAPALQESRELLGTEHVLLLGEEGVDLVALREALVDRGFKHLLSEGGPRLLGDLVRAGVVDELCLSVVPGVVGGDHSRITVGGDVELPLELQVLLEEDGTLLGRWWVARG